MLNNLFRINNFKKTLYYMKKNGIKKAYYAVKERAGMELNSNYVYEMMSEIDFKEQIERSREFSYKFSILVPAYETNPIYFKAMVDSVLNQTYSNLELVIADASSSDIVEGIVKEYQKNDARICYRRLHENKGISGNTNQALQYATGDYVGLLDHDDILTQDALYEMAEAIREKEKQGIAVRMLYSDEDKCNGEGTRFFEPHWKPSLNLDLILTNNYICHFLVMKKELIQTLELRSAYDGAQDYDLVLRAIDMILGNLNKYELEERLIRIRQTKEAVVHIERVLYHWRCHDESTASNPQSKEYAYEAGKRAIEDVLRKRGWNSEVFHTVHLGFYRIEFMPDMLKFRPEVGIIGGKLINSKNKITGGIYKKDGEPLFNGLHKEYSGYMHLAGLRQEAEAVDIRCLSASPEVEHLIEDIIGLPYMKNVKTGRFDWKGCLKQEADYKKISLQFCQKVREAGFLIVWNPNMIEKVKY